MLLSDLRRPDTWITNFVVAELASLLSFVFYVVAVGATAFIVADGFSCSLSECCASGSGYAACTSCKSGTPRRGRQR